MRNYVYALTGKEDYYFNNLMYTVNPSWLELVQQSKNVHTDIFSGALEIDFIVNRGEYLRYTLSIKGHNDEGKVVNDQYFYVKVAKNYMEVFCAHCSKTWTYDTCKDHINVSDFFDFRFITNLILISPFYKLVVSSIADDEEIMSDITRLSKQGIGFEKILQLKRGKIKSTQYGF